MIGSVKSITLSKDHSQVQVAVQLSNRADDFAVKDTRFWVVRPRIGASGVTGIGTLLSGAYIGVDAGRSKEARSEFVGLEAPPPVTGDQKGRRFTLHGDSLGSIDIGSPIFYRRVQVGQVYALSLDKDGTGVTMQVFVAAPYDQYVGTNSRWWHASGVNVRLDSNGFVVNTQSLTSILIGGLSFRAPPGQTPGPQAADYSSFHLASDEADAKRAPDTTPVRTVMKFNQSLRGLSVGAVVDFRGIVLGAGHGHRRRLRSQDAQLHDARHAGTVSRPAEAPGARHGGPQSRDGGKSAAAATSRRARAARTIAHRQPADWVELYVALDIFPKAAPVSFDPARDPLELPTIPNSLDALQTQVAEIAKKLERMPFDQIGTNLNNSLKNADKLFTQLSTEIMPQARDTLAAAKQTFGSAEATLRQDSPVQADMHRALQELTRTLQSLNALADYLERHPESLVRGKSEDKP